MARSLSNPTTATVTAKAPVKQKDRDPVAAGMRDAAFAGLAAALLLGFFGLRAFGETLARYDPIG